MPLVDSIIMEDILTIREITSNSAFFYNESQTISGELRATHDPNRNITLLDKDSENLSTDQTEQLNNYYFSNYH